MWSPQWMKKIRPVAQHGGVVAHAAARLVDASRTGRYRPTTRRRRCDDRPAPCGSADLRFARDGRRRQILEPDAIEDVLVRRQSFEQNLAGKIRFRQHVDCGRGVQVLEALGGGHLDQHPRRPVGAGPDHA